MSQAVPSATLTRLPPASTTVPEKRRQVADLEQLIAQEDRAHPLVTDLIIWVRNFSEAMDLPTSNKELVFNSFVGQLGRMLKDSLDRPLTEEVLLGSDNNIYTSPSLALIKQSNPARYASLSASSYQLLQELVKWHDKNRIVERPLDPIQARIRRIQIEEASRQAARQQSVRTVRTEEQRRFTAEILRPTDGLAERVARIRQEQARRESDEKEDTGRLQHFSTQVQARLQTQAQAALAPVHARADAVLQTAEVRLQSIREQNNQTMNSLRNESTALHQRVQESQARNIERARNLVNTARNLTQAQRDAEKLDLLLDQVDDKIQEKKAQSMQMIVTVAAAALTAYGAAQLLSASGAMASTAGSATIGPGSLSGEIVSRLTIPLPF